MDIERYDADTAALINECLKQQKDMDPKILKTLAQLKKIATKADDAALLGFTYFYLANTHYMMELNYDQFRLNLTKAIPNLQSAGENGMLARAYNFIGLDACNNGSYDVAYHYFTMALRVAETIESPYFKAVVNANLGQLYARLGNVQLARQLIRLSIKDTRGSEDDIFYYHNLISSYYLEGAMSIRLNDLKSARRAEKEIAKIETLPVYIGYTGVQIVVFFLRAQLALIDNDRQAFDGFINAAVDNLHSTHLIFDFMEDIYQFSFFLIEKKEFASVRRILDKISNSVLHSPSLQMKRLATEIEIAYYEETGDDAQTNLYLRRKHELDKKRESEQNRIYLFSIGLVDALDGVRKTQLSRKEDREALKPEANTDVLTGLPNRIALNRMLEITFERALTGDRAYGIGVIDIDDFASYNESHTKEQGDICLQQIAGNLRALSNRPGIHCARFRDDTFVVIYENMKDREVLKNARMLEKKIHALAIPHGTSTYADHVTISQGICNGIPKSKNKLWDYLMAADAALRGVKKIREKEKEAEGLLLRHPPK